MRAKILPFTPENIQKAAQAIQEGAVVGMPTETVYGLAGDSQSPLALTRIFETKERPTFDPLIIHVNSSAKNLYELECLRLVDASKLSADAQKIADQLIQRFWPGPLTLVLPKHSNVPELATSGLQTVALRMPQHPIAQALIAESGRSLAAPSANRFGRISPTSAQAVAEELGDRIDWILDGGNCSIGVESTVVSLNESGEVLLLRPGGVPQKQIEEVLGARILIPTPDSSGFQLPGPGMLQSHYSPSKPFRLLPKEVLQLKLSDLSEIKEEIGSLSPQSLIGLLTLSGDCEKKADHLRKLVQRPVLAAALSEKGDLQEAAQALFSKMRWLDASSATFLVAEPCLVQEGLGHAIRDRLTRASARH